jgi:glycosyltransferase involved in cell wall biosynthesis
MAYGKPVVAPRGSGPDAIVNASNGLLFRSGDDLDLARMLAQMQSLSGQLVPSSIRLGCLQQFGEAAVVARLRAVYERVVTKPHAPAETFEDAKA